MTDIALSLNPGVLDLLRETICEVAAEARGLGRGALAHPAADYTGWELVAECAGTCARQTRPMEQMLKHLAPGTTVGAMLERLRCRCGAPMQIAELGRKSSLNHAPDWLLLRDADRNWRDRGRGSW